MSWTYRDIQTFPALYGNTMLLAAAHLGEPVLFNSFNSFKQAEAETARFRHYRWCLRQHPEVNPHLSSLEERYQFRFSNDCYGGIVGVYLKATPTQLSTLIDLNPHLAPVIAEACQ
jgi:hypothetical protein